jgi:hypothetical protein
MEGGPLWLMLEPLRRKQAAGASSFTSIWDFMLSALPQTAAITTV